MSEREIELSAGTVQYTDEGSGSPVVLLHGLLVSGSFWHAVAPRLVGGGLRVIVPELPLGSHRIPLRDGADRSPKGVARLIGELIEKLELDQPTIAGVDTGGALAQLLAAERPALVGRLVLGSCDSFEAFLPPLFKPLQVVARIPGGLYAGVAPLRLRKLRRLPIAFGRLTKTGAPAQIEDAWIEATLANAAVRRDASAFLEAIDSSDTLEAAEKLRSFDKPALVAWSEDERVFPKENGRRLAAALPNSRLELIRDSYTFSPLDNPEQLSALILDFVRQGQPAVA